MKNNTGMTQLLNPGLSLYRIKMNDDNERIIYHEKIFIGDRIRDIIYNDNSNEIYLSLELDGELGIISKAK